MVNFDDDMDFEETAAATEKKKKGGKEGAAGQAKIAISPALLELMKLRGISMERLTEMLREWVHLKGEALHRMIEEFAHDPARASAHLIVQFTKSSFTLVTDFVVTLRDASAAFSKNYSLDSRAQDEPRPS